MKEITINKCTMCPYFDANERLRHGLYETDDFYPYCSFPDNKVVMKDVIGTAELETIKPSHNCPIQRGIILKSEM